jgi:uncharacterized phage protein gp47/JayE
MSKKRVRESRNGVTLTEVILFGGAPRRPTCAKYIVQSPRKPEGREFDTLTAAQKYFNVQASLRSKVQAKSDRD